jgi:hypothetical protein
MQLTAEKERERERERERGLLPDMVLTARERGQLKILHCNFQASGIIHSRQRS